LIGLNDEEYEEAELDDFFDDGPAVPHDPEVDVVDDLVDVGVPHRLRRRSEGRTISEGVSFLANFSPEGNILMFNII